MAKERSDFRGGGRAERGRGINNELSSILSCLEIL